MRLSGNRIRLGLLLLRRDGVEGSVAGTRNNDTGGDESAVFIVIFSS